MGHGHWALAKQGIGHWALAKQEEYLTFLRTAIVFFSDRTVSQILGEFMDIRRDCQSWLAVREADYHDRKGKAQAINKAPQWLIPARIYETSSTILVGQASCPRLAFHSYVY